MARLPYIDPGKISDPRLSEALERIAIVRGEVTNLFRVVANQPAMLDSFFGLSHYVRDRAELAPRVREVAILATALELGVGYEVAHHRLAARRAGISPEEITALESGDLGSFTAQEQAAIGYARQVARYRDVDGPTFDRLAGLFPARQVIEIAVTVAWYHLVAAIVGPLRVELESDERAPREGVREP